MSESNADARWVVDHMMQHDRFSQWLGIEVLEVSTGQSKIRMKVREEMVNGFGIAHGGIAFSLADSAFAFACKKKPEVAQATLPPPPPPHQSTTPTGARGARRSPRARPAPRG